jgi:hypothetical protein
VLGRRASMLSIPRPQSRKFPIRARALEVFGTQAAQKRPFWRIL